MREDLDQKAISEVLGSRIKRFSQLAADAARYRFIRAELARASSLHMDGTSFWRLASNSLGRHATLDAAIDAAIKKEANA